MGQPKSSFLRENVLRGWLFRNFGQDASERERENGSHNINRRIGLLLSVFRIGAGYLFSTKTKVDETMDVTSVINKFIRKLQTSGRHAGF